MKVHELLVKIGFNIRVQGDEESFVGEIENDEEWCLHVIYNSKSIGMQIQHKDLRNKLISSLAIDNGEELAFILIRLLSFRYNFPVSYSRLVQFQAELSEEPS